MTATTTAASRRATTLFGVDISIPANPFVSGDFRFNLGNSTLATLGILTLGVLYFTLRKK